MRRALLEGLIHRPLTELPPAADEAALAELAADVDRAARRRLGRLLDLDGPDPDGAAVRRRHLVVTGVDQHDRQPVRPGGSDSRWRRMTSTNMSSDSRASTASPPGRGVRASASATSMNRESQPPGDPSRSLARSTRGKVASSGLKGRTSQPRNPHTR